MARTDDLLIEVIEQLKKLNTKEKKKSVLQAQGESKTATTSNEWVEAYRIFFTGISVYRRFVIKNHDSNNTLKYKLSEKYVNVNIDYPEAKLSPTNARMIRLGNLSRELIVYVKNSETDNSCRYTIDFVGQIESGE